MMLFWFMDSLFSMRILEAGFKLTYYVKEKAAWAATGELQDAAIQADFGLHCIRQIATPCA